MKPKFKTATSWEQANLLLQPAMIRVIDHLRQQLDHSSWKGVYQEISVPIPGYHLHLSKNGQLKIVDLWTLCYQVCFLEFRSNLFISDCGEDETTEQEVEIDSRLIDDLGEVDWQLLDSKAQHLVSTVFAHLPSDQ